MPTELPSDDEIRAAIRRGQPSRGAEAFGCVVVLICAALGGVAGAFVFDWVMGAEVEFNPQLRTRASLLIPAGVLVGLAVGVLAFRALRMMSQKSVAPQG